MKTLYEYSISRKRLNISINDGKISDPARVEDFLRSIEIDKKEQEHVVVLFLNTKNNITGYSLIAIGTLDSCLIHSREVFRAAIINNTAKIVIAHNHPSGDPTPSAADIRTAEQLKLAGDIIKIELLDFCIITETKLLSFKKEGLLEEK